MTDDIKLTAAFVGINLQETCLCKHSEFTRRIGYKCPICHKIILIPDYPKDMNALLGVMDKMDKEHSWPLDGAFCCGAGLITWACARLTYGTPLTDLPTVLFPLLVEAIKQIKESE